MRVIRATQVVGATDEATGGLALLVYDGTDAATLVLVPLVEAAQLRRDLEMVVPREPVQS